MDAGGYQDERYWATELAKRWLHGEEVTGGQSTTWLGIWRFFQTTPDWKEQLEPGESPIVLNTSKSYDTLPGLMRMKFRQGSRRNSCQVA